MASHKEKEKCIFLDYKSAFTRIFFNYRYENMQFKNSEIEEFWIFLKRFMQNKGLDKGKVEMKQDKYELLNAKLKHTIPWQWNDIKFLKNEFLKMNLHDCSTSVIVEFKNIILVYLDFSNERKNKKLEKLKIFQEKLPIFQFKQKILESIKLYSVILIAGDTGCGKSTQIPQYLLQNGYDKICCTQPRRIACISLRNRLAFETQDQYGSKIGYQIRFEKKKSKDTKVLFLTEGLLLRQMIEDPLLSNYNIIILDEIHERHLSCDFLLGAIKCVLNKRKHDLKVLLMSATVNCELFSSYFGSCPVVQVPGRLYPIKTEYYPIKQFSTFKSSSTRINPDPYLKILQQIDSTYSSSERGDALVFLSGFSEIETVGEALKVYAEQSQKWVILYLHSTLSVVEQDRVFNVAPEGVRKCILSTNIAETSLTIDGIRFVIDSGKVKEMNYDPQTRMHRLQEIWVSKASAEQRKGRAGRTGPGVCYRLYSAQDFERFDNFSKPEIQRVSLDSLILNMVSMGLSNVRQFPFLQMPESMNIENTLKCLISCETLDRNERITPMGQILSKLPVDISIGKMLVLAIGFNLVEFMLSAAACLSVQSLVTNRSGGNVEALQERKRFFSSDGDMFTYINYYSQWLRLKSDHCHTRSWCRQLGLEEQRLYEVTKLRNQFKQILVDCHLIDSSYFSETSTSKSERIRKHGEKRLYINLKEKVDKLANKKPKLLNLGNEAISEADESDETKLKDTEFRLVFDAKHLMDIESRHRLNKEEIDLVKLVTIMSFYPNLAIADPDNASLNDTDKIFHTKEKPFVMLHPSSVYYNYAEATARNEVEHSPIGELSVWHYLFGYTSIIETNKTYICNCYQVSAIHALLLTSHEIYTNQDCTRLVCDEWIELHCISAHQTRELLILAFKIRKSWTSFLQVVCAGLKENDETGPKEEDRPRQSHSYGEAIRCLKREILNFMKMRVKYTIRRLLSADLKHMYNYSPLSLDDLEKSSDALCRVLLEEGGSSASSKGGIRFSFLYYNCLKDDDKHQVFKATLKPFECAECLQKLYLTKIEQVRHIEKCGKLRDKVDKSESHGSSSSDTSRYFCEMCNEEFVFGQIDILRHRKRHSQM